MAIVILGPADKRVSTIDQKKFIGVTRAEALLCAAAERRHDASVTFASVRTSVVTFL